MTCRETEFLPGRYYHIYNRGCNRGRIFRKEENYRFLIRRMRKFFIETDVSVIAYCLMPNHYHFLLRQISSRSVGKCVQLLFNSYSKAFNSVFKRTGTLFEGPFKSVEIEDPDHLILLCRYIHLNPVKALLVKNPDDWEFSNYPEWIGIRNDGLFDKHFVDRYFGSPDEYKSNVLDNHVGHNSEILLKSRYW